MKKYIFGILILSLFLTGCWGATTDNTEVDQTTPAQTEEEQVPVVEETLDYYTVTDINKDVQDAKNRYDLATGFAKEWQTDAQILLVSTKYVGSLRGDNVVDRFLYVSNLRPDLYFAIDISRMDITKYTRNLIYTDDYVLRAGVKPIPLGYWKTSATKALEIADSTGGAQYRKDNPNYQVTEVLSLAGGNNLAWYIVYSSPDTDSIYEIVIDCANGQEIPQ
jgi:hypothetical protein